ncbi:hypothetical protein NPIL_583131 [Nephila pilipes]|uniref:Uncharacterized protein n=1 Tax=Nephila pilipes TaxID=299642 RepID=A0A8X6T978_NEPPI|nr:hypothetical protein NPIL_583131 [Nephila pilipes]
MSEFRGSLESSLILTMLLSVAENKRQALWSLELNLFIVGSKSSFSMIMSPDAYRFHGQVFPCLPSLPIRHLYRMSETRINLFYRKSIIFEI